MFRGAPSSCLSGSMRGYRGVKYTLFLFCYVFWVVSAVLIAVGIYAKIAKEKAVVDALWVDPALLFMLLGSFSFLLNFLGCSGSLRNSVCLLNAFVFLLVLVLVLQVVAACLCFLFTDTVLERTERLMMRAVVRYRDDPDLQNAIDFVQRKFGCCGVENGDDWSGNAYFACHRGNPSLEACGVPYSCCRRGNQTVLNTMCGYGKQNRNPDWDQDWDRDWDRNQELDHDSEIYTSGCLEKIVDWTKKNLHVVGGLTLALLTLEVCLLALAVIQICWIKRVEKTKGPTSRSRKWEETSGNLWLPPFTDFNQD